MNVQTWEEQVKTVKARPAPPIPSPVRIDDDEDEANELLERIAIATERTAARLGVIEFLVALPLIVVVFAGILVLIAGRP